MSDKPKLRSLDFQPVTYQGQQMWLLRDPLQLNDQQLIVPAALAPILIFCDGRYTPQQIQVAFSRHVGEPIDFSIVANTLAQLDGACLLENQRSQQAQQQRLEMYRRQPHRPPALADLSYPGRPDQLTRLFESYSNGYQPSSAPWNGRAMVSPHIDYQRGGPVYAQVWRQAETAVLNAEMVIIFGTDHNGGQGTFTLTRQAYATPYGVLPTDVALIDKLATAVGPEAAYAEELHHHREHAIELSAVWLHYIYHRNNVAPKPMIPILCGSFYHFINNGAHPAQDELLMTAVATLQRETAGKKVLAVASVDFAHVGPNFGDSFKMDAARRSRLREQDQQLIEAVLRGDAADFYNQIAAVQDQNRICGFSPIYLMLHYLNSPTTGQKVAYDHCPADDENYSLVSISGLLLD